MKNLKTCAQLCLLAFFLGISQFEALAQSPSSLDQILKEFLESSSVDDLEKKMYKMIEEMDSGALGMFEDRSLDSFLGDSGLLMEFDHGQHEWSETETQRVLTLKLELQKDSPLDIKIENNQIRVQAKIEKETINQTDFGETRSLSVQQYARVFLVPEDCVADSVQIENIDGGVSLRFDKKQISKSSNRPLINPLKQPLKKDEDGLTI